MSYISQEYSLNHVISKSKYPHATRISDALFSDVAGVAITCTGSRFDWHSHNGTQLFYHKDKGSMCSIRRVPFGKIKSNFGHISTEYTVVLTRL